MVLLMTSVVLGSTYHPQNNLAREYRIAMHLHWLSWSFEVIYFCLSGPRNLEQIGEQIVKRFVTERKMLYMKYCTP